MKKSWKIVIIKGVCPSLKFEDAQCDLPALERAHWLKFRLWDIILDNKHDNFKIFWTFENFVNFGIRFESYQYSVYKKSLLFTGILCHLTANACCEFFSICRETFPAANQILIFLKKPENWFWTQTMLKAYRVKHGNDRFDH